MKKIVFISIVFTLVTACAICYTGNSNNATSYIEVGNYTIELIDSYHRNFASIIPDSLLTKIDSYFRSQVESVFVGVGLIADKNGVVFYKAHNGKRDNIDTGTTFGIAATSKCLTSTAILQLHGKELLSVNDSITKYFENVPVDKQSLTIRQLLNYYQLPRTIFQ